MSDPTRLLEDDTELTDSERRLLVAGTEAAPPPELGAELWAALAAKLPPATTGPRAPHPSSALPATQVGGVLLKVALGMFTVGALVLGARALLFHDSSPPVQAAPKPLLGVASQTAQALPVPPEVAPSAASVSAPIVSALPAHTVAALHSGKAAPAHSAAAAPAAAAASSDASEESRAVAEARNALRGGNSTGALSILSQAQQRFGAGVLGQEREALTIEALAKAGQSAAARARGQVFLKNYTNSPYSARIRALIGAN